MRRVIQAVLALLCLSAGSCSAPQKAPLPPTNDPYDGDTVSVYQAALRESRLSARSLILILNETTTDWQLASYAEFIQVQSDVSWLPADVGEGFLKAAAEPAHHKSFDNLGVAHAVLTGSERAKLIRGGGVDMELFFQRYPDTLGLVTLSRVSFSADHKWAVVYVSLVNGSMGGFGRIYIFDRNGPSWHRAAERDVWES